MNGRGDAYRLLSWGWGCIVTPVVEIYELEEWAWEVDCERRRQLTLQTHVSWIVPAEVRLEICGRQ